MISSSESRFARRRDDSPRSSSSLRRASAVRARRVEVLRPPASAARVWVAIPLPRGIASLALLSRFQPLPIAWRSLVARCARFALNADQILLGLGQLIFQRRCLAKQPQYLLASAFNRRSRSRSAAWA